MSVISKKICLIGAYGVGKTSLITRFVKQTFSEKYLSSLGVKIDTKEIALADQKVCKLVIWDIAGKESYSSTDKSYIKGAAGCLLVVDGTRSATVDIALNLRKELNDSLGDLPCVCAINKFDLRDEWEMTDELESKLNDQLDWVFTTSALSGDHVESAFNRLAELLVEHE